MDWYGKQGFTSQSLREWHVGGKVAGKTRSHEGLTFATVFGAGHMVRLLHPARLRVHLLMLS